MTSQIQILPLQKEELRNLMIEVYAEGFRRGQENPIARGLLDMDAASEYLKVSKTMLYQMVAAGGVPHRKIGKLIRFDESELRAFQFDPALSGGEFAAPCLPRRLGRLLTIFPTSGK